MSQLVCKDPGNNPSNEVFCSLSCRGNALDGAALDVLGASLSGLAHLRILNIEYGCSALLSFANSSVYLKCKKQRYC